jgi:MYXO-CTERM domain-containing protein
VLYFLSSQTRRLIMRNRFSEVAVAVISLLLVAATMVGAAGPYNSSAGGTLDSVGGWNTSVIVANAQGNQGACGTQNSTAYYQWNLMTVSDSVTIGDASITIPIVSTTINSPSVVTLYGTTADTWPPVLAGLGGALSTAPLAQGATSVTFPTSGALVTYLQQALGDNTANFGVRWSVCNTTGDFSAVFNIRFNSTAQLTLVGTNAVELTTLEAQQPAPNLPIYIGLGALALLVLGGLLVYRRRVAAR